ncbi:PLP-dependent aminotransferase family protein [Delftia sp. PS-11]|uniref:aminotransferase-like domain-containing protein n=1 Tax=Delftia sp. PS-11 TaxID=2767222 RepID=UPI0024573D41|nr:PLP-dependent aminotransferase family protein [Delftia sp. PS-11]KAJ8743298.1 PLP-dependent aminotransferase family protein [Delftia sp. PS-11]
MTLTLDSANQASSSGAAGHWRPLRSSDLSLVEQLVAHYGGLIRNHGLRAGARLPSVRALAEEAGVSRDTVVQAYDRLAAQGLIHSRRGAGFFVSALRTAQLSTQPSGPAVLEQGTAFDTAFLLRNMFREGMEHSGGAGMLPPEWLDRDMLASALRAVGRSTGVSLLTYGAPQGYAPLRQQIASVLQSQDVPAHPESNLMTVAGVTQGLDLIVRSFVQAGDTVLVEDPGWFLIFGLLTALGVNVVGVPRLPGGPDVEALERLARQHSPRLFILNTAVHNPTGQTLSAGTAHEMLRIAERHDFLLVEDDTYSDFLPGTPVRLAALDRLQRVLLVGGYSKTLAASLRVGYVAAQADLIRRLTDLKLLGGLTTALPGEQVVHRVLADGQYRKHVERLRERVDRARGRCLRMLEGMGCRAPHEPQAGMFAWVDCGMDSEVLARHAAAQGLLLAPGLLFSPRQAAGSMLRIPVPMVDQPQACKMLGHLLQRHRGG